MKYTPELIKKGQMMRRQGFPWLKIVNECGFSSVDVAVYNIDPAQRAIKIKAIKKYHETHYEQIRAWQRNYMKTYYAKNKHKLKKKRKLLTV